MKLKNRNLYKKAFRAEFFLIAQEKLSDINRVEEFKENIMLDHRTETSCMRDKAQKKSSLNRE